MAMPTAHEKAQLILFALFLASVVAFLDRQLLNILIRPIRADIGIDDVEFSLIQGAGFSLIYAVFTFPMAYLADRLSRKKSHHSQHRCLVSNGSSIWPCWQL